MGGWGFLACRRVLSIYVCVYTAWADMRACPMKVMIRGAVSNRPRNGPTVVATSNSAEAAAGVCFVRCLGELTRAQPRYPRPSALETP